MEKLKINFENCYGIKKLEKEFTLFSEKNGVKTPKHTLVIYAPNGVMKTSFAKTFKDLSNGQNSLDLIFKDRINKREIADENNIEIKTEEVFVIEPYNEQFDSDKKSTLLVKKELKEKYDEIHKNIDIAKDNLLKNLKQLSGLSGRNDNIQIEIEKVFKNDLFTVLEKFEEVINNSESTEFSNIIYNEVFNDKVLDFLKTKDFRKQIKKYIETYNEVIENSDYLIKEFNHYNASTIHKTLKDNGFFTAKHSINLNKGEIKKEVISDTELDDVIKKEKEKVLNNPKLQKEFEAIDKKLSSAQLRQFRDYLFDNKEILEKLENLDEFQKQLWIDYFINQKDLFIELLKVYKNGKSNIQEIVKEAGKEKTDWERVVNIFNDRFSIPFRLRVGNKEDVLLKDNVPAIEFIFKDLNEEKNIQKSELLSVLSQGERRALYLLNIIFEVEAREKLNQKTLFIVDDIADSFDYKNKYAIIEYLKKIGENDLFYQIILTHNFDFFRTIQSRLNIDKEISCFIANKNQNLIILEKAGYFKPFDYFKKNLTKDKILIASIPFLRNLAEYCNGTSCQNYLKLTSLLHIKNDTYSIKKNDLEAVIKNILPSKSNINLNNKGKDVVELIFELSNNIINDTNEGINLENKIILSIATRLKTEEYMINKINDNNFCDNIKDNQTIKLIEEYKKRFPMETSAIEVLDRVNLMTPENIHLNSFMYEPILDISDYHLKEIYKDIKRLKGELV